MAWAATSTLPLRPLTTCMSLTGRTSRGTGLFAAGFAPGTVATPLPVFANFSTTNAGETPGLFASSGAWDNQPLDNPTDENATGATDSNTNPFLDVTPGSPANSARNMMLGYLGSVTSGSQPGAAANEIRVWVDDLPGTTGGGRRTWFDGLVFVPAGTNVFWEAALNRDERTLTVTNTTSQSFTVVGYSILSAAGSLNGSGAGNAPWNNLTAGTLPGFTDTDNDWAVVGTPTALSTELREQDGGLPAGAQDGIVVAPGGVLDFGDLWQLAPFEDVQILLRLADATPADFTDNPTVMIPAPVYSGTAAVRGDFTGDGDIGVADYISLMQNLHKPQGTLTRTAYYRNGDFNDDNVVNRNDFYPVPLGLSPGQSGRRGRGILPRWPPRPPGSWARAFPSLRRWCSSAWEADSSACVVVGELVLKNVISTRILHQ